MGKLGCFGTEGWMTWKTWKTTIGWSGHHCFKDWTANYSKLNITTGNVNTNGVQWQQKRVQSCLWHQIGSTHARTHIILRIYIHHAMLSFYSGWGNGWRSMLLKGSSEEWSVNINTAKGLESSPKWLVYPSNTILSEVATGWHLQAIADTG